MPKKTAPKTLKQLAAENEELRARLNEAEETLNAIVSGEVDALVVSGADGAQQVFTLKGAEYPYRVLVENMSEGTLTLMADGSILYANQRFAEMLKSALNKVIGSAIQDWVAPDSQRLIKTLLQKDGSEQRHTELALFARDGTRVPVQVSANKLFIEDLPASFCLVVTDITELKRAEEDLRQSAFQNSVILETAMDGFWKTDRHTQRILEVNDAYCRMSGYSREELLQMTIAQLDALEKYEDVNAHIERVKNQLFDRFETIHRRKDGSTFDVELSVQYLGEDDGKLFSFLRDITARKQMETELKERERKLSEANLDLKRAESEARIGNWKWNLKTATVEWSDEMYRIFGLDRDSYTGRLGDVISKVIHPDDLHIVLPSNASAFTANQPQEYRIIRPADGAIRHIWAKAGESILDEQGNPLFLTGVAQDITERKQAEQEKHEAVERFNKAFLVSPIGINIFELSSGRSKDANQAYLNLIGYSRDELIGHTAAELNLLVESREHWVEPLKENGVVPAVETAIRAKSGEIRHTLFSLVALELNGEKLGMVLAVDITERKHAEAKVLSAQEAYRALADNSPDSVDRFDREFRHIYINATAAAVVGKTPDEVIGKTNREIGVPDVVATLWENRLRAVFETGEPFEVEDTFPTAEGAGFFSTRCVPERSADGTVQTVLAVSHNITDRKRVEDALKKSEREFRLLAEAMPQIVWVCEPNGENIYFNQQWVDYTGLTLEESYGDGWNIPFHPDERKMAWDAWQNAVNHGAEYSLECRLRRADGAYTWWLIRGAPVYDHDGAVLKWFGTCTDINKLKVARDALRESEQRLREVLENSMDASYKRNLLANTYDYMSPVFDRISGYTSEEMKNLPIETVLGLMHPDDQTELNRVIAESIADTEGKAFQVDYRFKHKDGQYRWLHDQFIVMRDELGQVVALIGSVSDITENKKAEEDLRQSQANLNAIFNATDEAIFLISADETLLSLNKVAAHRFGRAPEELVGRKIFDIMPASVVAYRKPFVYRALYRAEYVTFEDERNGRWMTNHLYPILDKEGQLARLAIFSRDITEKRQAESTLRLHSRMLENIAEGVYLVRASDGVIVYANPQFEKMFGYDAGELIGSNVSVVNAPTDKSPGETAEEIMESLKKDGVWKGEVYNIKKDGSPFWCHANVSEFDHADFGKVWVSVHQDISERKQVEQEILQLNEHLEKRVQERTVELVRANQVKNEFLAMMSHELRTPLGSVLGFSETLLEGLRGELNERQELAVQMIRSSGMHLLGVINDVLDISKIQADNFVFNPEKVDVQGICKTALVFIDYLALQKSIEVEYIPPEVGCIANADPKRLKQILINLLSNAVKFTSKGGKVRLEVKTNAQAKQIRFAVTDSGIGISAEDLPKLFQPFVQLDTRLSRQYEGTGLGLVLVKKLVEMHGGSIEVQSEVGTGSCFAFFLPWEDQDKQYLHAPVLENEQNKTASSNPAKILIADDDKATIMLVQDYLEDYGYQVFVVEDGGQVIPKVEQVMPDVILMDIQMPYVNGLELTRRLRSDPRFATVPIIALTAFAMYGDRERCLEAGMSEYLSKPVILKELKDLIESLFLRSHK